MSLNNAVVARLLRQYAGTLVVEGADRFRVKAYRRAADTIEVLNTDVAEFMSRGEDLKSLPGIGEGISRTIEEIIQRGQMPQLERSIAQLKPELVELTLKPQLDPKKVQRIYKKLNIHSLEELQERLDSGEIREVFGARIEFHVRNGLDERPRKLLYHAQPLADKALEFLKSLPGVYRVSSTGSLRRKQDTVGDLNFLIASKSASALFKQFVGFGGLQPSTSRNAQQAAYSLSDQFGITLRWTELDEWGLSWILSTGSVAHLDELTQRASKIKHQLTPDALTSAGIDISEEEPIYRSLGLSFIEPELREGRGEIKAALKDQLPDLIQLTDLRGDLHMHTTASDGVNSLAEMASAAKERGYEYISITDHSQSLKITNGLTEDRLRQQIENIEKFNARSKSFTVLKSAEVDILADGSLDYSDAVLKELDLTVCSIHSRFGLNKEQQTDRVLRAMDNPYFNILGHATGRLLLKREGYELDMERIIRHAKANGCFFEINSSPDRLDLSDENAKLAKEAGIKIAINTDAHSLSDMDYMPLGVNQARRAWLSANDVLNTLPLAGLLRCLRR
ncbi:MAG: polymerase [Planctomycetaceae bacterium]|nr:polymerase [Planctomycetaceae bacterium]